MELSEGATLGTIGGFALGVLVARPLSNWFGAEVSAITTVMGVRLCEKGIEPETNRLEDSSTRGCQS